jgi:hypothetical protein
LEEIVGLIWKTENMTMGICRADHATPSCNKKVGTNFADKAAVSRSVQFAHGLRTRSLVFSLIMYRLGPIQLSMKWVLAIPCPEGKSELI